MKKVVAISAAISSYFSLASQALAQSNVRNVDVLFPNMGIDPGSTSVGALIANALKIAMIVAALVVLFYLVLGAFQWITSGGEKDKVGKARGTIVHALIGLAILALAGLIVVVVGQILNINVLNLNVLPTLNSPATP
jgi:hypothetical protein